MAQTTNYLSNITPQKAGLNQGHWRVLDERVWDIVKALSGDCLSLTILYFDEFQNFITPSMAEVMTGARKYSLGLILAHQGLDQLLENDRRVASMVLNNPCIRICFRIGNDNDARKISEGFSFFEAKDLTNPDIGEASARIEKVDCDFNLITFMSDEIY